MPRAVSIVPFLRYVAEDVRAFGDDEGYGDFVLADSPNLYVALTHEPTLKTPPAPESALTQRCTDEGNTMSTRTPPTMKLPEAIQSAAQAKIQATLKPIMERLSRLRAVIDSYEVVAEQDAEQTVTNQILIALGEAPDHTRTQALTSAKKELREALSSVADLVDATLFNHGDIPTLVAKAAPPAPQPPPPAPQPPPPAPRVESPAPRPEARVEPPKVQSPPPPPPSKPVRKATQEDIAWAKRLISEVETLRSEVKQNHPSRLFHLLQAIVAEVRLLLDRLPEDNFLHERLGTLVPTLGALRVEGGVDDFIRGLAFGHTGDWELIAHKSRGKVREYDRDVVTSERAPVVHPNAGKSKRPSAMPEPEKVNEHVWPELPRLRGLTKPILLAGGILIPEKLKSVQERFGLDMEWHEIDHDNPRASQNLVSRIRNGKVGAIILLEGVMRHSTYKPVTEACKNHKVVYAMGDKAGLSSLQTAFDELERKLAI